MADEKRPETSGATAAGPSPELAQKVADAGKRRGVKPGTKRGPYDKGAAGPRADAAAVRPAPAAQWTPQSASFVLACIYAIPAAITGFPGFRLSAEECSQIGPLGSEIFNDLLPYDAGWVKLAAFGSMLAGITAVKIAAYKQALALEKKTHAAPNNPSPGTDGQRQDPHGTATDKAAATGLNN